MRMTMRGLYALKALAVLAAQPDRSRPLALRRIADEEEISMEFLQQIFFRLRKAGLIAAARGPGGGFYLARPASAISVMEVFNAAGETFILAPCEGEDGKGAEEPSRKRVGDPTFKFLLDMEKNIKLFASSTSLADLVEGEPAP